MISQSAINSFISLIAKRHSHKHKHKVYPQLKKITLKTQEHTHQIFKEDPFPNDRGYCFENLALQHTHHHHYESSYKDKIQSLLRQPKRERNRKENSLYSLYRQSIDKKKENLLSSVHEMHLSEELRRDHGNESPPQKKSPPKEISFPISRPSNRKQGSFKMTRRRQLNTPYPSLYGKRTQSNYNISNGHDQKNCILQVSPKRIYDADNKDEKKKQKPFFRVKKRSEFRSEKRRSHTIEDSPRQETLLGQPSLPSSTGVAPKRLFSLPRKVSKQGLQVDTVEPWGNDEREQILISSDC